MYSKIYIGKKQIELLIKEVQSKPALYDSSAKGYTDRRYKTLLWDEISTKLGYPANDCKKKWKGIRDSYVRSIKDESCNKTPKGKLKKDYMFFKHLHFLTPYVLKEKNYISPEGTLCKYEDFLADSSQDVSISFSSSLDNLNSNKEIDLNDSQMCEIVVMPEHIDGLDDKNRIKNENSYNSLENELYCDKSNEPEENSLFDKNESDEDLLYFQSLIPSFKKLSSEDKSWIKLKLMELIHDKLYGECKNV